MQIKMCGKSSYNSFYRQCEISQFQTLFSVRFRHFVVIAERINAFSIFFSKKKKTRIRN